jgi:hypothetical protein
MAKKFKREQINIRTTKEFKVLLKKMSKKYNLDVSKLIHHCVISFEKKMNEVIYENISDNR